MRHRKNRSHMLPQRVTETRKIFEVIEGNGENPHPTPPAASAWVPRADREAIVSAFKAGVSIYMLGKRQRRPHRAIESVLRDHMDEQQGYIRSLIRDAQLLHIARRAA